MDTFKYFDKDSFENGGTDAIQFKNGKFVSENSSVAYAVTKIIIDFYKEDHSVDTNSMEKLAAVLHSTELQIKNEPKKHGLKDNNERLKMLQDQLIKAINSLFKIYNIGLDKTSIFNCAYQLNDKMKMPIRDFEKIEVMSKDLANVLTVESNNQEPLAYFYKKAESFEDLLVEKAFDKDYEPYYNELAFLAKAQLIK